MITLPSKDTPTRRLLAAVQRRGHSTEDLRAEAVDFDWNAPARYTSGELETIQSFASELAGRLSKAVGKTVRSAIQLAAGQTRQVYAGDLPAEEESYALCVSSGDAAAGEISFPQT